MDAKTNLDLLKEEMMLRGCSKVQTEAKAVAVILDIVSHSDIYSHINHDEQRIAALKRSIEFLENEKLILSVRVQRLQKQCDDLENKKEAIRTKSEQEICEYINKFYEALNACETAEGRDLLRIAQTFVNSVSVDTKYDNTAFIIGLASILSGGSIDGIEQLKKINKALVPQKAERKMPRL